MIAALPQWLPVYEASGLRPRLAQARGRDKAGAGLGLIISRQIAQAHAGSLTLLLGDGSSGAAFELRHPWRLRIGEVHADVGEARKEQGKGRGCSAREQQPPAAGFGHGASQRQADALPIASSRPALEHFS